MEEEYLKIIFLEKRRLLNKAEQDGLDKDETEQLVKYAKLELVLNDKASEISKSVTDDMSITDFDLLMDMLDNSKPKASITPLKIVPKKPADEE